MRIRQLSTTRGVKANRAGPQAAYDRLVGSEKIRNDPAQQVGIKHLQRVFDRVLEFDAEHFPSLENKTTPAGGVFESFGFLDSFMGKGSKPGAAQAQRSENWEERRAMAPRGLYLHGGPGSGKTFLMELFHEELPLDKKRRVHFHEFMLEVHRALHKIGKRGVKGEAMMEELVDGIAERAQVLCFDEFQVTDIADAMVIRTLFDSMWRRGLVLVATSNRAPDELYKNGIQRDLFVGFIEAVKVHCRVVNMQSSVDYRMVKSENFLETQKKSENKSETWIVQVDGIKSEAAFERLWTKFCKGDVQDDCCLRLQGRVLDVPLAGRHTDVARFSFDDLCEKPLGAADYYAIASTFHTVFLSDVPQMDLLMPNQVRRFITLIDTLYDQRVIIVVSAATEMNHLFAVDPENKDNLDVVFAFDRTLSRLNEMQTTEYLEQVHRNTNAEGSSPVRFLSQFGGSKPDLVRPSLSEGDVRQLFDRWDLNEDGQIDKMELRVMMEEIMLFSSGHRTVNRDSEKRMQKEMEMENGKISYASFRDYFEKHGIDLPETESFQPTKT